ncbi:hypothetical protein ACVWXN_007203 [Bradyrhizobium sp. i1.4.4]
MPSYLQAAAAPVDIARTGAQELGYIADVSAASQPILLFSKRRPGTNKPASSLLFLQQPWPPAPAHRGKPHSPRVQLRCHFARMSGMDAIVTPPGGHQDRWIGLPGSCAIVGRIGFQPLPIRSVVGIAIFGEPARPREQSDAAAHVDQRDGAEQCAEALGISRSYVGDEDRRSIHSRPRSAWPVSRRALQVRRRRLRIIMRQSLAGEPAGVVPARAELAAAAQNCLNRGAVAVVPKLTERGIVVRFPGDPKPAISAHMDRRDAGLSDRAGL